MYKTLASIMQYFWYGTHSILLHIINLCWQRRRGGSV